MTEVRFARSGNVDIAYRVVGDGPIDLVNVPGAISHLEIDWELPQYRHWIERLAEFTRVIQFDKRGTGMSDRAPSSVPLEDRMQDVQAVMDAVGSERAAIMGAKEGGPISMLFAAAHPERTVGLILQGGEVRERRDEEWPWGEADDEEYEAYIAAFREWWGKGLSFGRNAPSVGDVEWGRAWFGRRQIHAATPAAWAEFARMAFEIDVRHIAPAIRVPTLVIHAVGDRVSPVENGRFLARSIPGARYVELPGEDHVPWFNPDERLAEIREFLTGQREASTPSRMLATVLFTDLVDSTALASELGDRHWRHLVEQHHAAVRRELLRFDGVEVDTAGDGFFATFDGPARAIRCAQAIVAAVRRLGVDVRVGLHTGELERADGKVAGIAVNIGSRVAAQANAGEVLVSGTVKDLVAGSGLEFEDRGITSLKGIPGEWRLFSVRPLVDGSGRV